MFRSLIKSSLNHYATKLTCRHLATQRKRFYKEVSITSENDTRFEINLDGRKVKTPNGQVLHVRSRPLAMAVANEWDSQVDQIRPVSMHLTSLCNTAIDNPMKVEPDQLIGEILDFLDTDTLCYRSEEPHELHKVQEQHWTPITDWFQKRFECSLNITTDLIHNSESTNLARAKLLTHLTSFDLESLIGLQFMVENLKSLILSLALIEQQISVDQAVQLSKLEAEFQIGRWGRVEWAHDLDREQTRARVAAALLFVTFNNQQHTIKKKIKKQ